MNILNLPIYIQYIFTIEGQQKRRKHFESFAQLIITNLVLIRPLGISAAANLLNNWWVCNWNCIFNGILMKLLIYSTFKQYPCMCECAKVSPTLGFAIYSKSSIVPYSEGVRFRFGLACLYAHIYVYTHIRTYKYINKSYICISEFLHGRDVLRLLAPVSRLLCNWQVFLFLCFFFIFLALLFFISISFYLRQIALCLLKLTLEWVVSYCSRFWALFACYYGFYALSDYVMNAHIKKINTHIHIYICASFFPQI